MTSKIYAVGDIHGHIDQLDRALELIRADGGADAEIVFLGDLVDRGPDSRAVIARLRRGQAAGKPWRVIKGNHDHMFSQFLRTGDEHDRNVVSGLGWLHPRLGGGATLMAYGVADPAGRPRSDVLAEARAAIPRDDVDWVGSRPLWVEREGLLFVHAGIRPGVALNAQREEDLIWIRDPFLAETAPHPWLVVHGHTALDHPQHHGNRVNLDGGAGYGRPLHPAVFEAGACWLLSERGRVRLTP